MRLKLFSIIIISLFLFFSGSSLFPEYDRKTVDENLNATESPDHIMLTWSGDPTTTQTITWRGAFSIMESFVKYKEDEDSEKDYILKKADLERFTTIKGDKKGSMNIFSVMLSGLKPGTKYAYHVLCGKNSSANFTFTTAPKNADVFSFLIFGDSQSGSVNNPDYSPWHDTVTTAYKKHKDAKFIVNMGDMVEIGQKYIHWNNWFDAAREVISLVPEMAVLGNHENYSLPKWRTMKPVYFNSQFKLIQNGPEGLKGRVYSFDYGNAHITVLDSQQKEEAHEYGDILKAQRDWLDKDLGGTKQIWKIVFFHKPPYSNYFFRANNEIKKAFCPVIDKYHADIVFNGHDHVIARTYPVINDEVSSDPSKGTVYYTTGRSGNKYHNYQTPNSRNAFFYNPQDQPCYLYIQIDKLSLGIKTFKLDGSIIDSYEIEKK